jgi:hypothetical protein
MKSPCSPARVLTYRTRAEMMAAYPRARQHYEDNGVILLEDCGIDYDAPFIAATSFPPEWKKIGTVNGITLPPIVLHEGKFHRTQNPLCGLVKDDATLLKLYSELLRLELGFKLLVAELFADYRDILWYNCTFRFVKTESEPVHLDAFGQGRAFPPEERLRRLKLFLNVDSQPRVWNVGPPLPEVLAHLRPRLPASLPDDLNVLCDLLNKSGALAGLPVQRLEIPPRGVVFANGSTVAHQVVSGNRMVSVEGVVRGAAASPARACEWDDLPRWIEAAGYGRLDPLASGVRVE